MTLPHSCEHVAVAHISSTSLKLSLLSPSWLHLCALMSSGHTPSSCLVFPFILLELVRGASHLLWHSCSFLPLLPTSFPPAFLDVIHGGYPSGGPVLPFPVQPLLQELTCRSLVQVRCMNRSLMWTLCNLGCAVGMCGWTSLSVPGHGIIT